MKNISKISTYQVFKHWKSILKNPLPFHYGNFERLGDTFKVHMRPGKTIVSTRSPEFIKQILQKTIKNTINWHCKDVI